MNHIQIKSISELHRLMQLPAPTHPLISLVNTENIEITPEQVGTKITTDLYMIALKDKNCGVEYGRNSFDFEEGVMVFSAPGQTSTAIQVIEKGSIKGFTLYLHPELIRNTSLGSQISNFQFFNYGIYEALHLSEAEQLMVIDTMKNIEREYIERLDTYSNKVIISLVELLLHYSSRYYERQFSTRSAVNKDILSQFEINLQHYFKYELNRKNELPSIQYFAEKAFLSPHYFSDLIKKETGRTPKDHIHKMVIEKAKNLLLNSNYSISEISYDLGFNYPHYFSRLFKKETGMTPVEYRSLN